MAFEHRGVLLGPWVTDRGNLRLQAFAEGLLRQDRSTHGMAFTEQARLLLHRTAVSGDVQLSDGRFVAPGVQAKLVGRAQSRNRIRAQSEAVGRGLTAEMASLSVQNVLVTAKDMQVGCNEINGAFTLRLVVRDGQLRFAFQPVDMKIQGLNLCLHRPNRECRA